MKNTNDKPKQFGQKKRVGSGVAIAFSALLAAGALAGSGVSIWHISKNYTESSEFNKSVAARVKIDPNEVVSGERKIATQQEAQERVSSAADRFSKWLKNCGNTSYDVSYETVKESETIGTVTQDVWYGYLNTQFPVDKIKTKHPTSKEDEDKKIDNDSYLSYFANNGFNTNNKTLVYRWYDAGASITTDVKFTIVPFEEVFNMPSDTSSSSNQTKVITDSDGKYGVAYKTQNSEEFAKVFENLRTAKKDSEKKKEEQPAAIQNSWGQPRLYIVSNLEGLYNEANYHISNYVSSKNYETLRYQELYSGSNYEAFAKNYQENLPYSQGKRSDGGVSYHHLHTGKNKESKDVKNLDLFHYLDSKTAGTVDSDASFANKYIDQIVTINNYTNVMPAKINDDYKNTIEETEGSSRIQYFWLGKSSKNQADTYLGNEVDYGFNKVRLVEMSFDDITAVGSEGALEVLNKFKTNYTSKDIAPSFTESLFRNNNLVAWLCLGFLIFLLILLIILAALYRTTGVFSWISLMFALSMTALLATLSSSVISMSLLFGMFIMAIAGFIGCLGICGRMKRRLLLNEDTPVMFRRTFRKSLLPLVDISVITLIFGVCFTYVAPISLNPLGLALIIGAFMNFLSVYLLNMLMHALFMNNQIMFNRFNIIGKPSNIANEALAQSNPLVPNTLDATKLDFAFYSRMSKKKLNTTDKRAMIALIVVACILIAGMILFAVLGSVSSTMFHTSTCVAIKYDGDLLAQSWFTNSGLNYSSYKSYNGWYYFYTSSNVDSAITYIINNGFISGTTKYVLGSTILNQTMIGSTNQDILNKAIIAMVIASSAISVYAIIRCNWIAFVPMLAGSFLLPMLILGLGAICQVKFDQFVILCFALTVVINSIVCLNMLGSINEAWSRRDAYTKDEFKFIVNTAIANNFNYIWTLAIGYGAFILLFGLFAPTGLLFGIVIMILGLLVSLLVSPFAMGFLLYQFMKVRNFALGRRASHLAKKVVVNYDEIDEQELEGINKFTKRIPVSTPTSKPQQPQQGEAK